jgi:DNA repair photolyase
LTYIDRRYFTVMPSTGLPIIRPPIPSPANPAGIAGRGASANPPVRFEKLWHGPDPDWTAAEDPSPATEFFHDRTESIVAKNESPDVGFERSINPYRGCEHGCIYCYARPSHEYLGWSAGLDFESRILVKTEAPRLLREELSKPTWRPQVVAASGVTDCYQPVERRLRLTRACIDVLAEFRNPVAVITKNQLVARDADVFADLAQHQAVSVTLSVTSLRQDLSLQLEPRASVPAARLAAIRALADAGVPVGVNVMPVIPGLTDHEIPAILDACAQAGARWAGFGIVRLPHAVAPLFEQWLTERVPTHKDKVLARLRALRGGKLSDPRFGTRHSGEGPWARQIADLFRVACRKAGLLDRGPELSAAAFRRPGGVQQSLF